MPLAIKTIQNGFLPSFFGPQTRVEACEEVKDGVLVMTRNPSGPDEHVKSHKREVRWDG